MIERITPETSGNILIAWRDEQGRIVCAMPETSLDEHIHKHPDIGQTPEEYLRKTAEVIQSGRDYDGGKLHRGVFTRVVHSEEVGVPLVFTTYNRFGQKVKLGE